MSPSEADLRAALHDGDSGDDSVAADRLADRVMARARRRRAQTRSRVLSAAAVTVVIAAGGTGLGLLGGRDGGRAASGGSAATSVANGAAAAGSAAPQAPTPSSATIHGLDNTGSAAASAVVRCPPQLPRYPLSGAAVPADASTARRPLFGEPVTSLVLCAYGSAGSVDQDVLQGASAQQIVASLEAASTTRPAGFCSLIQPVDAYDVAIVGITAAGRPLRPVTAAVNVPACRVRATNGTAVRYGWAPPAGVAGAMLARLGASVAAQSTQQSLARSPAGHVTGSPARS